MHAQYSLKRNPYIIYGQVERGILASADLTFPFLIPIKYLTLSTSPSRSPPSVVPTLNPILTLLPPVPTNTGSFGYYSQYPSSVPHPIIRGPSSPSDAIPTIKKMSYRSFVHYTMFLLLGTWESTE